MDDNSSQATDSVPSAQRVGAEGGKVIIRGKKRGEWHVYSVGVNKRIHEGSWEMGLVTKNCHRTMGAPGGQRGQVEGAID